MPTSEPPIKGTPKHEGLGFRVEGRISKKVLHCRCRIQDELPLGFGKLLGTEKVLGLGSGNPVGSKALHDLSILEPQECHFPRYTGLGFRVLRVMQLQ